MREDLKELQVVIVDCQTTGMSPPKAHLLEIGWAVFTDADNSAAMEKESFIVSLPDNEKIPPRISGLTGITDEMLIDSIKPQEIAQRLHAVSQNRLLVAHYAQFEKRWIDLLFDKYLSKEEKPIFICTREIIKRLHPDIPSTGIRAIAGYYGYTIPEKLRVAEHVEATVHIWKNVISELEEGGVTKYSELKEYLTSPASKYEGTYDFPMDRAKRLSLPDAPGIYKMLSADGTVLYIGKAKSLRSRVNSYFTKRSGNRKKLELAVQVYDVSCVEYSTRLEAALAEYDAIQEYNPQYNTSLRNTGEIVYFTQDFMDSSPKYGGEYMVGPIQVGKSVEKLSILLKAFVSGETPDSSAIGIDYMPLECKAMTDGFRMFTELYFELEIPTMPRLIKIGKAIQRESGHMKSKGDEKDDELKEPESVITAETVLKHIEWLIAESSRLVRLSRWIVLLSQSCTIWISSGKEKVLEINDGEVKSCFSISTKSENLSGNKFICRDASIRKLNPVNCGRMRVLTAELRRLKHAGREVMVVSRISGISITGSRLNDKLESV